MAAATVDAAKLNAAFLDKQHDHFIYLFVYQTWHR